MVNYDIISEEAVSNSFVLEEISKTAENVEELTYREEKVLEYVKKLDAISLVDFKKAFSQMEALEIPRLGTSQIIKLIDMKPIDGTQIRAIISNSGTIVVDENVTKILDVLKNYN